MHCESCHSSIAIFCVGNYYLSDDGIGIHLYNELKRLSFPKKVHIYQFGLLGFSQIEYFLAYRKLIIVDAVKGYGNPGDIIKIDLLSSEDTNNSNLITSHDIGIFQLLSLVRLLYPSKIPNELILIGIESKITNTFSTKLSPVINNAMLNLKNVIINEIQK